MFSSQTWRWAVRESAIGWPRGSPPRQRGVLHAALLAASLACLPIIAADRFRPAGGQDAAAAILVLLAATIGPPYFLLASTGPLLQSWLARRWPARSVYRLFALSNACSLTGLLGFPPLVEPRYESRPPALRRGAAYPGFPRPPSSAPRLSWRPTPPPPPPPPPS